MYADSNLQSQAEQYAQKGDFAKAVGIYKQLLEAEPESVDLLSELAITYAQGGRANMAVKYFKKASKIPHDTLDQTFYNIGFTYSKAGFPKKALKYYRRAIKTNPNFYEAYLKAAFVHKMQGQNAHVVSLLTKAIDLKPNEGGPYMYLADTLNNMKRFNDAIKMYDKAIEFQPENPEPVMHQGDTLLNIKELVKAQAQFKKAVQLSQASHPLGKGHPEALIGLLNVNNELCIWDGYAKLYTDVIQSVEEALSRGLHSPLSPYMTFFFPIDPALQLRIAKSHAREMIREERTSTGWDHPLYMDHMGNVCAKKLIDNQEEAKKLNDETEKIRIGYISRRFEHYPGTQLMLRVFGLHNRARFQVFAYANGVPDGSTERDTVKEDSDVFREVYANSPYQTALTIAQDHIHILIDYDGLHNFNNIAVLSHKPAPIIITYLGFAGTTGTDGIIDWIISDAIITPPHLVDHFTERIIHLPGTYQPQDHLRIKKVTKEFTRQDMELPPNAFVFMCFNRLGKIDETVFKAWMEILRRVDGSVLWLYNSHNVSANHLQLYAEKSGIDQNRIIFANKLSKEDHMARIKLADILLDTLHYNAHTTASDALWVGVPVLTFPGQTFSSRAAASIISAAGIPELVVNSLDEYIETAVRLGSTEEGSLELSAIRKKLIDNIETQAMPFYNTKQYVQGLERAYTLVLKKKCDTQTGVENANKILTVPPFDEICIDE